VYTNEISISATNTFLEPKCIIVLAVDLRGHGMQRLSIPYALYIL
jgi:hypothetical protein